MAVFHTHPCKVQSCLAACTSVNITHTAMSDGTHTHTQYDAVWRAVNPLSSTAFTSAPPLISKGMQDALLNRDAIWRAVNPSLSTAFTSAPPSISKGMHDVLLPPDAIWRAVSPGYYNIHINATSDQQRDA